MQLIKELLQINEDLLNEDLGALKQVDKKFRNALFLGTEYRKDSAKVKAARLAGKNLEDYEKRIQRHSLKGGLGEKSTTEEQVVKNPAELIALINNPKYGALLLKNGVHQYAIFVRGSWAGEKNKTSTGTKIAMDFDAFNDLHETFAGITDADRSSAGRGGGKLYKMGFGTFNNVTVIEPNDGIKSAEKLATYIMTLLKSVKLTANVTCFVNDTTRKEKSTSRADQRKGMVPDLRNDRVRRDYESSIKSAFKGRLDKFKSDKSVKVDTPDEALKAIVDKGYLDKITIAGITYDYADDRINFRALRSPSKTGYSGDDSYITYKINSSTPEYKRLSAERDEMRQKFLETNRAAGMEKPFDFTDEQEKQLAPLRPASEFKLMLKLDGAKIVPGEIRFEQGFLW